MAHIRTEEVCQTTLTGKLVAEGDDTARWLNSSDAVCCLHAELIKSLSPADLQLSDGGALVPGQLRQRGVGVGRHEAPTWPSLPLFLA